MPSYQTLSQSGAWRPGGAGRFYVNPQQRPGIREGQLSVGRSLLPSALQLRGACDLGGQGLGQLEVLGTLASAAIQAGGAIASSVMAQKAAKKAAARDAKAARDLQRAQAEQDLKLAAASAGQIVGSSGGGASASFLSQNWPMIALAGGGLLAAVFLIKRR